MASREELDSLRGGLGHESFERIYDALQKRCSLILEAAPVTEAQWRATWKQGSWASAVLAARTAQGRIIDLAVAHHVDRNAAYRDRAVEELKNLLAWSTWTDPCYSPLAADLCTAECAATAVIALDWLWEDLAEVDRLRVLQAVRHKALRPYLEAVQQGAWWYTCYHNWNAVVNSGCALAGLALSDEEPAGLEAYRIGRRGLERFFDALGREGGWDEGIGYWGYAMRYLVLLGHAAERLLDDQSIFHKRGMDATGLFPVYFTPNGHAASFGDQPEVPLYGAFYLLVRQFGQKEMGWWLDTYAFHGDARASGWSAAGLAMLFRPPDAEPVRPPDLLPVKVFNEIGWAAMADHWPRPSLYVAAKTGDLAAHHSQRDMNSLQVQVDGEMLLVDPGNPPYSREYLSEARAEFYEAQACSHNTLTVGRRDHRLDAQGSILEAQWGPDYRWVACDAGAACGQTVHFIRHAVMVVQDPRQVGSMLVVLDELLASEPDRIDVYWHTRGRVELKSRSLAGTITGVRSSLHLAFAATFRMSASEESHPLRAAGTDRVVHLGSGGVRKGVIASVFSRQPLDGPLLLRRAASGDVRLQAGPVQLHFKSLKKHLQLDQVRTA